VLSARNLLLQSKVEGPGGLFLVAEKGVPRGRLFCVCDLAFAVISGRVSKVQRNRGGIWIELQGSLVLRVAPNLVGQFDNTRLQALKGKQIEARGWIVDRSRRDGLQSGQSRWLLPLTDPSMLQTPR
jgi:hypothetical protein